MAITAWVVTAWRQRTVGGRANNTAPVALGDVWEEIGGTACLNIPPTPNITLYKKEDVADKAALDALDALAGVIVLSAINDDGTRVTGYLRPQDTPSGPQLVTARNRLQAQGVPLGELTTRVQVGMTMAQIADTMRDYAHDLRKDAQAAQATKQIG